MAAIENLETGRPSNVQWLFRQGELVLGPVLADQIVQKLYSGVINAHTEVKPLGENAFRRISEVEYFRVHLAKAQAKLRVDAIERSQREQSARRRNIRIGLVSLATLLAAIGAWSLAKYLAIHTPFTAGLTGLDITVEPPTITLANRATKGDDLVDYPLDRRVPGRPPERSRSGSQPARGAEPKTADPDGLQTGNFDRSGINAIVASRQKALYPCIATEVGKHPGLSTKIPIEFVIGNDGHVSKVWIDHAMFKEGPLQDCLLKELQKWPFKPYDGERATVGLSFKIGHGT